MTSGLQPLAGPGGLEATLDRVWNRLTTKDWTAVLAELPLFSSLAKRQLRKIASVARFTEFERGDIVVRAGEPGDAFYLVLAGRARVSGMPRARTLRMGDYFGEMALIDGQPRSTTITAVSELQTMKLTRRPFLRILEQEPRIAIALLKELSARVRQLERPATS